MIKITSTDSFNQGKRGTISNPVITVVETHLNHVSGIGIIVANFSGDGYDITRDIMEFNFTGWPTDSEIKGHLNAWIEENKITTT